VKPSAAGELPESMKTMTTRPDRPPTPEPVKRELRQRAGYGCCRCGFPIYQYHHIVPYSEDQHFRVEDMMLLCPNCHNMATVNALTAKEQRAIQEEPYNIKRGYASGMLKINQPYCAIAAGGTLIVGVGPLITVDGEPLLSMYVGEGGEMQVSITLLSQDDQTLAIIEKNEWVSGDSAVWDIESGYQRLTIRQAQRRISLNIDATGEPVRVKAELWRQGRYIRLNQAGITIDGHRATSTKQIDYLGLVGISLCLDSADDSLRLVPYLGEGFLVSQSDPIKRLIESVSAYRKLASNERLGR
jgi:hypothetical protein